MSDEQTVEDRASALGWVPKDHFRGDEAKWIDAETFVKRGEELMPLLRANNKKLAGELNDVKAKLAETNSLLKASAESIEALKEFNSKAVREQAKEKKAEIVDAIKSARESGDVEAEEALREQLQEQTAALKEAEKKPAKVEEKPVPKDYSQEPEWISWKSDNDWFGVDKRKTALAMAISDDLRSNPETKDLLGRKFLDKVSEEVDKMLGGGQQKPGASKVEGGGRGSGGGGSTKGKSFADLPGEAQASCDRQSDRLVGAGRAFKSKEEWRKHYVTKYFENEA